jgi:Tfp pilus assembly protein PilF
MAYLKAGDPKRGRQVLESATKMDPALPEAETARRLFGNGVN